MITLLAEIIVVGLLIAIAIIHFGGFWTGGSSLRKDISTNMVVERVVQQIYSNLDQYLSLFLNKPISEIENKNILRLEKIVVNKGDKHGLLYKLVIDTGISNYQTILTKSLLETFSTTQTGTNVETQEVSGDIIYQTGGKVVLDTKVKFSLNFTGWSDPNWIKKYQWPRLMAWKQKGEQVCEDLKKMPAIEQLAKSYVDSGAKYFKEKYDSIKNEFLNPFSFKDVDTCKSYNNEKKWNDMITEMNQWRDQLKQQLSSGLDEKYKYFADLEKQIKTTVGQTLSGVINNPKIVNNKVFTDLPLVNPFTNEIITGNSFRYVLTDKFIFATTGVVFGYTGRSPSPRDFYYDYIKKHSGDVLTFSGINLVYLGSGWSNLRCRRDNHVNIVQKVNIVNSIINLPSDNCVRLKFLLYDDVKPYIQYLIKNSFINMNKVIFGDKRYYDFLDFKEASYAQLINSYINLNDKGRFEPILSGGKNFIISGKTSYIDRHNHLSLSNNNSGFIINLSGVHDDIEGFSYNIYLLGSGNVGLITGSNNKIYVYYVSGNNILIGGDNNFLEFNTVPYPQDVLITGNDNISIYVLYNYKYVSTRIRNLILQGKSFSYEMDDPWAYDVYNYSLKDIYFYFKNDIDFNFLIDSLDANGSPVYTGKVFFKNTYLKTNNLTMNLSYDHRGRKTGKMILEFSGNNYIDADNFYIKLEEFRYRIDGNYYKPNWYIIVDTGSTLFISGNIYFDPKYFLGFKLYSGAKVIINGSFPYVYVGNNGKFANLDNNIVFSGCVSAIYIRGNNNRLHFSDLNIYTLQISGENNKIWIDNLSYKDFKDLLVASRYFSRYMEGRKTFDELMDYIIIGFLNSGRNDFYIKNLTLNSYLLPYRYRREKKKELVVYNLGNLLIDNIIYTGESYSGEKYAIPNLGIINSGFIYINNVKSSVTVKNYYNYTRGGLYIYLVNNKDFYINVNRKNWSLDESVNDPDGWGGFISIGSDNLNSSGNVFLSGMIQDVDLNLNNTGDKAYNIYWKPYLYLSGENVTDGEGKVSLNDLYATGVNIYVYGDTGLYISFDIYNMDPFIFNSGVLISNIGINNVGRGRIYISNSRLYLPYFGWNGYDGRSIGLVKNGNIYLANNVFNGPFVINSGNVYVSLSKTFTGGGLSLPEEEIRYNGSRQEMYSNNANIYMCNKTNNLIYASFFGNNIIGSGINIYSSGVNFVGVHRTWRGVNWNKYYIYGGVLTGSLVYVETYSGGYSIVPTILGTRNLVYIDYKTLGYTGYKNSYYNLSEIQDKEYIKESYYYLTGNTSNIIISNRDTLKNITGQNLYIDKNFINYLNIVGLNFKYLYNSYIDGDFGKVEFNSDDINIFKNIFVNGDLTINKYTSVCRSDRRCKDEYLKLENVYVSGNLYDNTYIDSLSDKYFSNYSRRRSRKVPSYSFNNVYIKGKYVPIKQKEVSYNNVIFNKGIDIKVLSGLLYTDRQSQDYYYVLKFNLSGSYIGGVNIDFYNAGNRDQIHRYKYIWFTGKNIVIDNFIYSGNTYKDRRNNIRWWTKRNLKIDFLSSYVLNDMIFNLSGFDDSTGYIYLRDSIVKNFVWNDPNRKNYLSGKFINTMFASFTKQGSGQIFNSGSIIDDDVSKLVPVCIFTGFGYKKSEDETGISIDIDQEVLCKTLYSGAVVLGSGDNTTSQTFETGTQTTTEQSTEGESDSSTSTEGESYTGDGSVISSNATGFYSSWNEFMQDIEMPDLYQILQTQDRGVVPIKTKDGEIIGNLIFDKTKGEIMIENTNLNLSTY